MDQSLIITIPSQMFFSRLNFQFFFSSFFWLINSSTKSKNSPNYHLQILTFMFELDPLHIWHYCLKNVLNHQSNLLFFVDQQIGLFTEALLHWWCSKVKDFADWFSSWSQMTENQRLPGIKEKIFKIKSKTLQVALKNCSADEHITTGRTFQNNTPCSLSHSSSLFINGIVSHTFYQQHWGVPSLCRISSSSHLHLLLRSPWELTPSWSDFLCVSPTSPSDPGSLFHLCHCCYLFL